MFLDHCVFAKCFILDEFFKLMHDSRTYYSSNCNTSNEEAFAHPFFLRRLSIQRKKISTKDLKDKKEGRTPVEFVRGKKASKEACASFTFRLICLRWTLLCRKIKRWRYSGFPTQSQSYFAIVVTHKIRWISLILSDTFFCQVAIRQRLLKYFSKKNIFADWKEQNVYLSAIQDIL